MGEQTAKYKRRNYLPKKSLQFRMIAQLIAIMVFSMAISVGVTTMLYYRLSNVQFQGDVPVYYITEDVTQQSKSVPTALDVLVPALLVSGVIMAAVIAVIGVFITHRIAGAIYRFERSTEEIGNGNLSLTVRIRHKDAFQELANCFNDMLRKLGGQLKVVREDVLRLKNTAQKGETDKIVYKTLSDLDYFKINK